MVIMVLLLNLVTAHPDKGKLSINPDGNASKTAPNPASLMPSLSLISGIRLAQLAKHKPAIKKKIATANRCAFRDLVACMRQR